MSRLLIAKYCSVFCKTYRLFEIISVGMGTLFEPPHLAGIASFQLSPVKTAATSPPNKDVTGVEGDMVRNVS